MDARCAGAAVAAADPSAVLEAAFLRIEREQMADVPILNPALRVQAVGFAPWRSYWLGAVVTPWFLNLVLVPRDTGTPARPPSGERCFHRFGAGDFAFLANAEPEVGGFESCSLVSPMADFPDQDSACATAWAALRMLHVEQPAATLAGGAASTAPAPAATPADAAPPSRRDWLFGRRASPRRPM